MELTELKLTARRFGLLQKMGITTLEQLLKTYPFRYESHEQLPFDQWQKGDTVGFAGLIASRPAVIRLGKNRTMTRFTVISWNQELQVTVFNRPWLNAFPFGETIHIRGTYNGEGKVTAMQAQKKPLEEGLVPVYSMTKGMKPADMPAILDKALEHLDQLPDLVPPDLRRRYRLLDKDTSYRWIHRPPDEKRLHLAIRTLKYEEFLCFQCAVQSESALGQRKTPRMFDQALAEAFLDQFPYDLTADQRQAIEDVWSDQRRDTTMYRLVQGDVGSGKTVVAMAAIRACELSGAQSALMAPTEILARQHLKTLQSAGIEAKLLVSSLSRKEKQEVLEGLKTGTVSVVVGTHSLFQDPVEFADLGLVVADEQQRFGVSQRRQLLEKGKGADFLMMSATPIPRTYAHFLYGDIALSAVKTMPAGRKPVETRYVRGQSMKPVLKDVLQGLKEGRQCYVVAPAIDENLELDIKGVTSLYEGMVKVLGKDWTIGLLHGRMSAAEKEEVMTRFKAGDIHILVSTTVIEVGIDVAKATMMVIYDAHRFGLSTIHQLRGRCARGPVQGTCWLLSATKDMAAVERLQKLQELRDGFAISEYDLQLRGPGDLLGTRQSGLPAFVLGDFEKDPAIMEAAVQDAAAMLARRDWPPLMEYVRQARDSVRYID
ncbi:ATP-dependent DNA helicase RecG [Faecalibaculum rodentium]|uniref:ATP-dependent DNA helicase RecG n=1 Tax=Faecalibaculum rodentium TaxID=1702221 RepID=A0A140DYA7_9FIRM|nr:ATP-dependent DNA helicase RecG [Faecalibaculum rodentium]AMK55634.1 ATP-dependent DNA helicase RecG [Faecalibaculum rodentium]